MSWGKRAVAPQERWDRPITRICPDARLKMHFRNHLEAIYCISRTGSIEDPQADEVHVVRPNIISPFDKHDAHLLCARSNWCWPTSLYLPWPAARCMVRPARILSTLTRFDVATEKVNERRHREYSAPPPLRRRSSMLEAVASPALAHPQTRKVRRRVDSIYLPWLAFRRTFARHGSAASDVGRRRTYGRQRACKTYGRRAGAAGCQLTNPPRRKGF